MSDELQIHERAIGRVSVVWFCLVCFCCAGLWFFSPQPELISLALFINLAVLSFYDFHYYRLPNLLTLCLFVTGLLHVWFAPRYSLDDHLIGAAIGLVFFPLLNAVYSRVRGRQGIGLGDAKLLAGLGLWFGWQSLPFLLLIASVTGLISAIFAQFASEKSTKDTIMTKPLPFGVFLAFAGWLVWLFF